MTISPLIIANWKMHLTLKEAMAYAAKIEKILELQKSNKQLIIAPPSPFIASLGERFPKLQLCAQDLSIFDEDGPYTGEISAKILASCGAKYSLIGHSERREYFDETNVTIGKKVQNAIKHNITPIICIGESLECRQAGGFKDLLSYQIISSVPTNPIPKELIIAYEPLWSIGTGLVPSLDQIAEVFELILGHPHLKRLAKACRLVYGGSVNSKNYQNLLSIKDIGGLLIGSASLKEEEITKILN